MKLLQILETVKSKTSLKGRTYKISSIIALIILGTLCGQNSIKSIARFGNRLSKPQRKKLGFPDSIYLITLSLRSMLYGLVLIFSFSCNLSAILLYFNFVYNIS